MTAAGNAQAVLDWLAGKRGEMLAVLEQAVNTDSGSADKPGADRMASLFESLMKDAGIPTRRHSREKYGDCVSSEVSPRGGGSPHVLLLGHMDTVFPAGTASRRPFRAEGNLGRGPGVADMKAGLVMNAFVARAFAELKPAVPPLKVLFTGDEEVASPASREITLDMARGALACFNAEPGRASGNVVTGRKGAFFYDFAVRGVAAHSGVNPDKGASAIDALARKVIDLHALADPATGVSANVGTVRGGMAVNIVAEHAEGQLDIRYPATVDREALRARIREIIERHSTPNTHAHITHEGIFLPLEPTPASLALLARYQASAGRVGMMVEGEYTGGSADSGLVASVGTPTICATGPVGGHVHTDREWCDLDTIVPRAQALALTILELGNA
jgi:glutamate carboxypeptidase